MISKHAIVFGLLLGAVPAQAQHSGHHIDGQHLGASVMPFDLGRSTHVFTPVADGGTGPCV